MSLPLFYYSDNSVVMVGDRIWTYGNNGGKNLIGTVEKVILPGTDESVCYSCENEGGILIVFDDGNRWVIGDLEEIFLTHRVNKG